MKLKLLLLILCLLWPLAAGAEPEVRPRYNTIDHFEITVTFGTDTEDSAPLPTGGSCSVGVAHSGTGTVQLWQVNDSSIAAASGTQVGADFTASTTTGPTKFNPGLPVLKAKASVASDGTVMTIRCTNTQVSSAGGAEEVVYADLPITAAIGDMRTVTDCATTPACASGGTPGQYAVKFWNGSAWTSIAVAGAGDDLGLGGTPGGNITMGTLDITFSSGDITNGAGSLVDGRDVSVDGAKLDGIEAEATFNGSYLLEDTNADDDYGPELAVLWNTLAKQAAVHDQSEMIIQLPCASIDIGAVGSTAVLGNDTNHISQGIILQGCGMGHADDFNPRAGTEINWTGASGGTVFQIGDGVGNDVTKAVKFKDFAVQCDGDSNDTNLAAVAFQFDDTGTSAAQNVAFENVSFHQCSGSTIKIGTGNTTTTSTAQIDTISFNGVYWDEVQTCIENTATNAVGISVYGGRCRFENIGYDIVAGDINTTNHVMEGPGSTAAFRFNDEFKPSSIVSTIVDSAGTGILTQGTDNTSQTLNVIGSRLSITAAAAAAINWTLGGYVNVTGTKIAGTAGATGIDVIFDNGTSQDLYLNWESNHLANSVDLVTIDYEGGANGDIIASGPVLTAADCEAPSAALAGSGTSTVGYVRGTICTELAGSQYYCNATDTVCTTTGTGWTAITGGGDVATDTIWDTTGDLAVSNGADSAVALPAGAANSVLLGAGVGVAPAWDATPAIDCTDCTNIPGGGSLSTLSDVTLTTPATGATLVKSGTDWVDGQLDLDDADAITGTLAIANTNLVAGTNISLATDTLNVDDAFLINSGSDVMTGTLTADGLTLGANENITLGAQTLDHDGTDFVFNDSVSATSYSASPSDTAEMRMTSATGADEAVIDLDDNGTTTSMNLSVDDATGDDQVYIELDGATDRAIFGTAITLLSEATPTTDADGEMSVDVDGWGTGFDAIEFFNGTASAYVVATTATDTPTNGQVPKWNTGGSITWEDDTSGGAPADLNDVTNVTLTTPGDGASLCFTGTSNASVDCTVGGDLTATEDSGTQTFAIAAGVINELDLDGDVAPLDGDFLQYDSTDTNFTWRDATETVSDLGLSNVENTALSTWAGSTNLDTLGAGAIDATTELAGALCGTNEILEDQGASWACIATPSGGSESNTLTTVLTGIIDDQFVIGGAGVATYDAVPDCDAAGSALTYDTTANNVDCATTFLTDASTSGAFTSITGNTLGLGSGTFTTLTFDAGASDPVITASSGALNVSTGTFSVGGVAVSTGSHTPGAGTVTEAMMATETFGDFACAGAADDCDIIDDVISSDELADAVVVTTSLAVGLTNPAETGAVLLENAAVIGWEDTEGTQEVSMTVSAAEQLTVTATENGIALATTTATECVMLNAGGIDCNATGGCTTGTIAGTNFDIVTAEFTAADGDGQWFFPLPNNIVTTSTATATITWLSDDAACSNGADDDVCWTLDSDSFDDGDVLTTATLAGTQVGVVSRCDTNAAVIEATFPAFTHSFESASREFAVVQVARDNEGTDAECVTGDDDYSGTAKLLSVEFCYEVSNVFSGEE